MIDVFNGLDKVLGMDLFNKLCPVIITDNGSKFSNPKAIELRKKIPCKRTSIFYCDAGIPYQKEACGEVNNELIRRLLPKGQVSIS